jgi:amino acid permease
MSISPVNTGSEDGSEAHVLLLRDGVRDNSWLSTAVIIVCSMAGVGMLSLPGAMQLSGWLGLLSMLALVALSAYMAVLMGDICQLLHKRGDPFEDYADIGYLSAGVFGRTVAQVGVYFSLFGVGVVFLILAGVLVNGVIPSLPPGFITIVAALVLAPICIFPKTFAELPFVGYVGLTATATTVVLASTFSLVYYHSPAWQNVQANYTSINITSPLTNNTGAPFDTHVHGATWMSQIRALSVFSFAFGGAATLPSLWLLMRKRERHWSRTMYVSYGATTMIVGPMAVVGYLVYGDRLAEYGGGITTILQTTGPAGDVAARICSALMVGHVLFWSS